MAIFLVTFTEMSRSVCRIKAETQEEARAHYKSGMLLSKDVIDTQVMDVIRID